MIISITQHDINNGIKALGIWDAANRHYMTNTHSLYREKNCLIALAAARAGFLNPHVAVHIYSDNYEPVKLPQIALDFCQEIVEGRNMFPFEFEIEEPILKNN